MPAAQINFTCGCFADQFLVCLLVGFGGAKTTFSASTQPCGVETLPSKKEQIQAILKGQ
jgi:hypothetical protein